MRKPFDMADKYEPLSYQDVPNQFPSFEGNTSSNDVYDDVDSEPTVRVHMPTFHPHVHLTDMEDDEPTIPSMQNPFHKEEKRWPFGTDAERRYPGVGLALVFASGILFWGFLAWLAWH